MHNPTQGTSIPRFWQTIIAIGVTFLGTCPAANAEAPINLNQTSQDLIQQRFSTTEISSINCENFGTLCQVISGSSVFYVNQNATHAFIGRVFDLNANRDLTEVAIAKLKAQKKPKITNDKEINWASLPLHDSIIQNENGKYEVAVLSDINCGYCRRFSSQIKHFPNIKVYEFLIGTDKTKDIANRIACSENPKQALSFYYANKHFLSPDCDRDITESANKIANQINLTGTPTFIRLDGEIQVGFESIGSLRRWIKESRNPTNGN